MAEVENKVLSGDPLRSENFFQSDLILRSYLDKHVSASALDYMEDHLDRLGTQAALTMDDLSQKADKFGPELKQRNRLGEEVNEVAFHPAYWKLLHIAAESEMFYVKYERSLRERFAGQRHQLGYAAGQLYAMSELGVYCPLCMTDGAAHLVDRYAGSEERVRLLPRLSSKSGEKLYTGAMFLTEKSGGSDVGRNLASAEQVDGRTYRLSGEKWFCSNVNAEVIMALARTGDIEEGTRGLSLFLVEKKLSDGRENPMDIVRLKEKLGVRSMATGEVRFNNTRGILLGEENKGFKLMAEMINISRIYNSVAAVAGMRRALIEAYQYLNQRIIFNKRATEHAMIRSKFHELGARYIADFLLVWRAIRATDAAEVGNDAERELKRILIPMAKWKSAEDGVYMVRECMELMGGNGYIEDFIMPKLFRDVNVLPIWEGSGNIIVLDVLRATRKSDGLKLLISEIREASGKEQIYGSIINKKLDALLEVWNELQNTTNQDTIETTAKPLFKELIDLYQMALIIEELDAANESWMRPAMDYLAADINNALKVEEAIETEKVKNLLGWKYP
ncbi:MAG: acyl-CoA dehydrogenase family protein [Balneolaceae bacterium]|nr:acyl-CoA dehydrogenase family protein [Balneolaceae bacterium]